MSISNSISRFAEYYKRHGLAATMRRAELAAKRAIVAGRMVVFYCDLDQRKLRSVSIPKTFSIERVNAPTELSAEHLAEMTSFWNPKLADRNIRERLEKGASLWMVECECRLAGYGWTLQGQAIEPYYFPLTPGDVQLFDFYVFPKFRGRAIHWLLTGHILHALAAEGASRAFADTGEWNRAQLASFKMTPFRLFGMVRTYNVFGHLLTRWVAGQPEGRKQKDAGRREKPIEMLRSNE
ncbi:MAG: GNAT family N-acetyltransferase [Terracidiphilus sp.]